MIADTDHIMRPTEGSFRCPFCTDDELVDADTEHKHDGLCGDREWTDELPAFPSFFGLPARELGDDFLERLANALECSSDELRDDLTALDVILTLPSSRVHIEDVLADEDDYWPLCPCCGRRGQLIVPLVELAA